MFKSYSEANLASAPDAILMDFDNTIYPYDVCAERAYAAVAKKAEVTFSIPTRDFETAYMSARRQVKGRLGASASAHSRLLYINETLRILGLGFHPASILELEQIYWREYLSKLEPFEGVVDFINEVRANDIPLGLVTNLTCEIQLRKLMFGRLDRSFDFMVTSEEAGADKPDPRPYLVAIEKAGLSAGKYNIWMIGDDIEADMQGAKQAISAITLLKTDIAVLRKKSIPDVDGAFTSFSSLKNHFDSLISGAR